MGYNSLLYLTFGGVVYYCFYLFYQLQLLSMVTFFFFWNWMGTSRFVCWGCRHSNDVKVLMVSSLWVMVVEISCIPPPLQQDGEPGPRISQGSFLLLALAAATFFTSIRIFTQKILMDTYYIYCFFLPPLYFGWRHIATAPYNIKHNMVI